METIITVGAIESLNENLEFLLTKQGMPYNKALEMQEAVFAKIRRIPDNPYLGQIEESISNSFKNYRRLIEGHYKIIYYVSGETIYVTDIFDSRQDPLKMKG